ncbi:MAG: UvrD-helicase domain-containing protein [Actinomycetota bacterium]|nr:UvrD-helicase domain-containing protein [Actinomycetota bacterium]
MQQLQQFDIRDPLPTGTTLLEASAGTGKTWTIGALVTRFVAEGEATLEEMLVVTFGRAASQELRERVRAQLVEAERALADPDTAPLDSEVILLLLAAGPEEVARRRQRLREALASFDAATIATTHQFCQQVLRSLGVAGDTDSNARLVEDLDDLLVEVVDDIYLRGFAGAEGPPVFGHKEALEIARQAAVRNPQAVLEPVDADPTSTPGRRVRFARAVRVEMDRRKRRLGILGYDDLLSQLADALRSDDAPARQRMRQRWRVVLVDEFQDTDPVQWQVLDRAFSGHARMVLIGDPKQAIYAFRGGDVVTYLAAARTATTRKTLGTNWRSDAALVDSLQVVLRVAALGDPDIVVHQVTAAHRDSRLTGAPHPAPLRVRVVRRDQLGVKRDDLVRMPQARAHTALDVARDIKALLAARPQFDGAPLEPKDVAVLAHAGARLAEVRAALHEVGVPAVIAGGGSVFATPGATEWLALLEGLEQPHRSARVRAAALTSFVGHPAYQIDEGGDALTDRVARRLRDWAELFERRGVAAVHEAAIAGGLPSRVLARVDGERVLTDLRHVGQSLHEASITQRFGLVALLTWLREQMVEGRTEGPSARTRRLDSDAAAVQLLTIHGSKGMQYPVVYLPYLAERHLPRGVDIPMFHGAEPDRHRSIDVGGKSPALRDHEQRHRQEEAGESLRLLYVALTRAQSQVITWWTPSSNTKASALHRMLLGRGPGEANVPDEARVPKDDEVAAALSAWESLGGAVVEAATPVEPVAADLTGDRAALDVRTFDRLVDTDWRRTSYTALSRAAEPADQPLAAVGSEPEEVAKQDEPALERPVEDGAGRPDARTHPTSAVPSPMADLPVGATFGSLVHAVLEEADPGAPDLRGELLERIREQLVRWPVAVDPVALADALVQVCDSPLGPLAGNTTLRGISRADRLCELDFELPLAGGDARGYPADDVTLGDVAVLLRRHLPEGDPLLPYADLLAQPALGGQSLRGYLTGSVDVVLRVDGRYVVVDYKTNWLGPVDEPLTAYAYRPEALAEAMGHSDYPLQALLYAVVLHRYLRWRQPGYHPGQHVGGVLYLYLRGMCGPGTPVTDGHPCGVFSWRPPVALVEELSDLLDGVLPAAGGAA